MGGKRGPPSEDGSVVARSSSTRWPVSRPYAAGVAETNRQVFSRFRRAARRPLAFQPRARLGQPPVPAVGTRSRWGRVEIAGGIRARTTRSEAGLLLQANLKRRGHGDLGGLAAKCIVRRGPPACMTSGSRTSDFRRYATRGGQAGSSAVDDRKNSCLA